MCFAFAKPTAAVAAVERVNDASHCPQRVALAERQQQRVFVICRLSSRRF